MSIVTEEGKKRLAEHTEEVTEALALYARAIELGYELQLERAEGNGEEQHEYVASVRPIDKPWLKDETGWPIIGTPGNDPNWPIGIVGETGIEAMRRVVQIIEENAA